MRKTRNKIKNQNYLWWWER